MFKTFFAVVSLSCILALPSAWAFESYFAIDTDYSMQYLASRGGEPAVSADRNRGKYWADASAILSHVDVNKLFAAAQDYDHYVQFGMPCLSESHVVERESPEVLFTWASMAYTIAHVNIPAQYYLEVRVHPTLDSKGGRGMEWQVVPRKSQWQYNEYHPRFDVNDGSFYILPLQNGTVYVRYFITSDIEVPLGGVGRFFGGNKIVEGALRDGAANVIRALAKQAAVR